MHANVLVGRARSSSRALITKETLNRLSPTEAHSPPRLAGPPPHHRALQVGNAKPTICCSVCTQPPHRMKATALLLAVLVSAACGARASAPTPFFDEGMDRATAALRGPSTLDASCNAQAFVVVANTTQLCSAFAFNQPDKERNQCFFLGLAEQVLYTGSPSATGPACFAALQQPSIDVCPRGRALPFPLLDVRPLPSTIPEDVEEHDGATLYWLYRNLQNFELAAGCLATNTSKTVTSGLPTNGNRSQDWQVPAGWKVHSVMWLPTGTAVSGGIYWPFAAVINKGRDVAILIRGTSTPNEWLADFDYSQTISSAPLVVPGHVHRGFYNIAKAIWPGIRTALRELTVGQGIRHAWLTGHSLGGGVGTLISYAAQEYLHELWEEAHEHKWLDADDEYAGASSEEQAAEGAEVSTAAADDAQAGTERHHRKSRRHHKSHPREDYPDEEVTEAHPYPSVRVNAALFAPPQAGDATFTRAFNKRVNARRVRFLNDIVPEVPCQPVMVGCPPNNFGQFPVPTNNTANGGSWPYKAISGSIEVLPNEMAANQADWAEFTKLYACQANRFAQATHICSYSCFTSRFVDDPNNYCRLRNDTSATGSYCYSFPVNDGPQYPFEA